MNKLGLIGIIGILAIMVSGCVTAGDTLLNDQNIKAGTFIVQSSTVPEIKQAGQDVVDNSIALKKVLKEAPIGSPEYSKEVSLALREQSGAEHTNIESLKSGVWDGAIKFLPAWMIAFLSLMGNGVQVIAKKLSDKKSTDKIMALVTGVQDIRLSLKEAGADKKYTPEEIDQSIKAIMKAAQSGYNVWPEISSFIESMKEAGKIKEVSKV